MLYNDINQTKHSECLYGKSGFTVVQFFRNFFISCPAHCLNLFVNDDANGYLFFFLITQENVNYVSNSSKGNSMYNVMAKRV